MSDIKKLRVMVVDDTILYRKIASDILAEIPDVEVVGTASNGKIAISKISNLNPDLLTLDIEMPEMNGLEVLEHIKKKKLDTGAIVLSTLTHEGGDMTIAALELGAFDFIPKPDSGTMLENRESIKKLLIPMLSAFRRRQEIKNILSGRRDKEQKKVKPPLTRPSGPKEAASEVVAIGVSTGGPSALAKVLPMISPKTDAPAILIVQHMPPFFTQSLARSLNAKCALDVREAKNGEKINNNTIYIAPGGKHMKVASSADGKSKTIRITEDPPENSCRPSVDYLFRSVSHHYLGRATGVIMTGMGSDGAIGSKLMKEAGSTIIVQDESTCTVFGMPREVIKAGCADIIAPLDKIAEKISDTLKRF